MGQILVVGTNTGPDKDKHPVSVVGPVHAPAAVFVATQVGCVPQLVVLLEPVTAYSKDERQAVAAMLAQASWGGPGKGSDERSFSLEQLLNGELWQSVADKASAVWREV